MVAKKTIKKVFWVVFVIVFILVTIFIVKLVYNSMVPSSGDTNWFGFQENSKIEITDNVFECENDNFVESRAYILLLGFGDHNKEGYDKENSLILKDPKVKGLLIYDYDEKLSLEEISQDFILESTKFLQPLEIEELIIVGMSAGGTVASYSLNKLSFEGTVELHTIASPLKGCDNQGFKSQFVHGEGFWKEIGIGFDSFVEPKFEYSAYHHKTVEDEYLEQCYSALEMQNNNLEKSQEFYYPKQDHGSIMTLVFDNIIDCHK